MVTLLTEIPEYCFPHELRTLRLSSTEDCEIKITCNGQEVLFTLTPDADGNITIDEFDGLLRDLADHVPQRCTIEWNEEASISFLLLPCSICLSNKAAVVCKNSFLTLQTGEKHTYLGAQEYICFFDNSESRPFFALSLLWVNKRSGKTKSQFFLETAGLSVTDKGNGYFFLAFSTSQFDPPSEGYILHTITATAGKERTQVFRVMPAIDADPVTLVFRNCFGQIESFVFNRRLAAARHSPSELGLCARLAQTFHFFGNTTEELKPTRSSASFQGTTRNYLVESVPEYTSVTAPLRPVDIAPFEDLCSSTLVYLSADEGEEICITDNELSLSNNRYEPQRGSIKWRYATNSRRFVLSTPKRTFDSTFDTSFS